MDIPLVLKETKTGGLVYSIPLWYRIVMLVIGGVLVGAIVVAGDKPSVFEWVALALVAAAAFYEERWVMDKEKASLQHRFGLVFAARTLSIPFERIEGFRLRGFARGSIPGASDEGEESARILSQGEAEERGSGLGAVGKRPLFRKAYVSLLCDDKEGGGLVINTLPSRRLPELKKAGARLAEAAGLPFEARG